MGKTRKFFGGPLRHPRGRKAALVNKARHGAVPPDPWDDIAPGSENRIPYNAAKRMLQRGDSEEAVRDSLTGKFGLRSDQATEVIDFIRERWRI